MSLLSFAVFKTAITTQTMMYVSCDKILQHDWTALYSAAGQGLYTQFTRPFPLLRKRVWLARLLLNLDNQCLLLEQDHEWLCQPALVPSLQPASLLWLTLWLLLIYSPSQQPVSWPAKVSIWKFSSVQISNCLNSPTLPYHISLSCI